MLTPIFKDKIQNEKRSLERVGVFYLYPELLRLEPIENQWYEIAMSVEDIVMNMPRIDKIRLMESIWTSLNVEGDLDSPTWHEASLKETEQRYVSGKEEAVDWNAAKERIRNS